MDTIKTSETIDLDRRRLLGTAATGIAVVGAVSLLPSKLTAAQAGDSVRPFRGVNVPEEALVDLRRRIVATRWPDRETVGCIPRSTALDDPGARALLGDRV